MDPNLKAHNEKQHHGPSETEPNKNSTTVQHQNLNHKATVDTAAGQGKDKHGDVDTDNR